MVETIAPVVYGSRSRYWVAVALHILGATIAASAFGALLGTVGLAVGAPWGQAGIVMIAAVAALYAAREALGLPLPIFDAKRQVPDWWRTFFAPHVTAFLYGLGLGVGFLTFLRHGTLVAVATAALISGDPVTGMLVVAPFGAARGLAALAVARTRDEDQAHLRVVALERAATSRAPYVMNAFACFAVAIVAFSLAL